MRRFKLASPNTLIAVALVLITTCLIYLMSSQISLRPATLIKPSVADDDLKNVAQGVALRMFPEFQSSHYILWGIKPPLGDEEKLFVLIQQEYERIFHLKVQIIDNPDQVTEGDLQNCPKPCWLLIDKSHANELSRNEFIEKKLRPLARPYINLTLLPFDLGVKAPSHCLSEKRLSLECLISLSSEASERKIKTNHRYFFLKKYNEKDFFLFLQETKK